MKYNNTLVETYIYYIRIYKPVQSSFYSSIFLLSLRLYARNATNDISSMLKCSFNSSLTLVMDMTHTHSVAP